MRALDYIESLRPAVPFSTEKGCSAASKSEVRRWLDGGSVKINGKSIKANDNIPLPVTSLVFFPKSATRKTTLV